jgi:hypothetical protein
MRLINFSPKIHQSERRKMQKKIFLPVRKLPTQIGFDYVCMKLGTKITMLEKPKL